MKRKPLLLLWHRQICFFYITYPKRCRPIPSPVPWNILDWERSSSRTIHHLRRPRRPQSAAPASGKAVAVGCPRDSDPRPSKTPTRPEYRVNPAPPPRERYPQTAWVAVSAIGFLGTAPAMGLAGQDARRFSVERPERQRRRHFLPSR